MAGSPSDPIYRLFNIGAVGPLSDAQLVDRFVARRDEAAEAAFEELVNRHGPMVLRVCRSVLHCEHDAEDAFQAVFLVLANRASSIRGSGSVASWLFGVAQRVANRSKRSAARRNALNQLVAGRTSESYLPAEYDPDWEILHEEIAGLPEQLRAPVVLCCLQGLTYAAAAHQLALSEMAVRGRLARARDRLRQRLTGRGVTVPGGLVVAGAAGQAQAPIPMTLIHSTSRIALGFLAGDTAAILARRVMTSMLLGQLRVAMVLLCLGTGGGYWAWHALGSAIEGNGNGQGTFGPPTVKARALSQPPRTDRYGDPLPPEAAMRLGTVRFRQASSLKRIIYSSDGQLVVTEAEQDILVVRGARDGKMVRQIAFGSEGVIDFSLSPDEKTIATAGFRLELKRNAVANHLTFTDMATGQTVRRGEWDDQDNVENVAYLPDGKTVATVNIKGVLRLWDVATAKVRHEERLGEGRFRDAMAFSRDARSRMLAIAWGQTIDLWDVVQLRRTRRITLDGRYDPNCLEFSPDGTTLAAGVASRGSEIRLWRVSDGNLIGRFKSRKNAHVSYMAYSPDGKAPGRDRQWRPACVLRHRDRAGAGPVTGRSFGRRAAGLLIRWKDARDHRRPADPPLLGPGDWPGSIGDSRRSPGRRGGPRIPRRRQDARLRQPRPDRPDLGPGDGTIDENAAPRRLGRVALGLGRRGAPRHGLVRPGVGDSPCVEPQDRRAASRLDGRGARVFGV